MTTTPTSESHDATSLTNELTAFIATEVSLGGESVLAGTDLVMTGLVDSLGVVLIVEWLEQRLGVAIDPSDVVIEHFESVDAMIRYLGSRDDVVVR